jgi:hypothetical protein
MRSGTDFLDGDVLLPDPKVCVRYDITPMTLWRWDRDPDLGFPKPIRIRRRKYRKLEELKAFDDIQRKRTMGAS